MELGGGLPLLGARLHLLPPRPLHLQQSVERRHRSPSHQVRHSLPTAYIRILFRKLERFIKYYFYVVVVVMILAFLDSIREMQKYADKGSAVKEVTFS